MPNYDFLCSMCGKMEERFAHMDDDTVVCSCGALMRKQFSPPSAFIMDIEPYIEHNLGPEPVRVESRKQLNELLKREGVVQKHALSHKDQMPKRWI